MTKRLAAEWHLRKLLALKGVFSTTELIPLLAERGINISRSHAHRLVVATPSHISLDILVALCDILGCSPGDLIEAVVPSKKLKKVVGRSPEAPDPPAARTLKPVRARIANVED
jgi:DNA-binding Xre family transcriptional regulator